MGTPQQWQQDIVVDLVDTMNIHRYRHHNTLDIARSAASRRKQTPERRWKTRHIHPLGSLSRVKQNRVLHLRVPNVKEAQRESHNRASRRTLAPTASAHSNQ
jgi:hypothetical protein